MNPTTLIEQIYSVWRISPSDITRQARGYCEPRYAYFFLMRVLYPDMSLRLIGELNGRNYTGQEVTGFGDSGGASRFFYCPKPSPGERNKGLEKREKKEAGVKNGSGRGYSMMYQNNHPTVKPINLMRYLVRLITPPGGTCYDPFNGSGTTGIACKLEGFNYVGTDSELEYIEMSHARAAAYHRENTQLKLI